MKQNFSKASAWLDPLLSKNIAVITQLWGYHCVKLRMTIKRVHCLTNSLIRISRDGDGFEDGNDDNNGVDDGECVNDDNNGAGDVMVMVMKMVMMIIMLLVMVNVVMMIIMVMAM